MRYSSESNSSLPLIQRLLACSGGAAAGMSAEHDMVLLEVTRQTPESIAMALFRARPAEMLMKPPSRPLRTYTSSHLVSLESLAEIVKTVPAVVDSVDFRADLWRIPSLAKVLLDCSASRELRVVAATLIAKFDFERLYTFGQYENKSITKVRCATRPSRSVRATTLWRLGSRSRCCRLTKHCSPLVWPWLLQQTQECLAGVQWNEALHAVSDLENNIGERAVLALLGIACYFKDAAFSWPQDATKCVWGVACSTRSHSLPAKAGDCLQLTLPSRSFHPSHPGDGSWASSSRWPPGASAVEEPTASGRLLCCLSSMTPFL